MLLSQNCDQQKTSYLRFYVVGIEVLNWTCSHAEKTKLPNFQTKIMYPINIQMPCQRSFIPVNNFTSIIYILNELHAESSSVSTSISILFFNVYKPN